MVLYKINLKNNDMRKINIIIMLISIFAFIALLCVSSAMCVFTGNSPVDNYPNTRDFCNISLITCIISFLIGSGVYCFRKILNKENRQLIKNFWNDK